LILHFFSMEIRRQPVEAQGRIVLMFLSSISRLHAAKAAKRKWTCNDLPFPIDRFFEAVRPIRFATTKRYCGPSSAAAPMLNFRCCG
jgi:hypothetical protein